MSFEGQTAQENTKIKTTEALLSFFFVSFAVLAGGGTEV